MKGFFHHNEDGQVKCCSICVYSRADNSGIFCEKRNKPTEPLKKCRKFEIDIMSVGVKRKRVLDKEYRPEDFQIK